MSREKRRLLIVYDLASQPFSVGDLLVFQEASLVLRQSRDVDLVDLALVYDRNKPTVSDPAFSHINSENFLFHLSSILPAAQVNPYLGSLLLFDSHAALESYVADNPESYHVWPPMGLYAGREYLFYYCFNDLFYEFHRKHGVLPDMASRPPVRDWANSFLKKHAGDAIAGTVQLRRNPNTPWRNSNNDAWLSFFNHCADRYPVSFVVICSPSELDDRFRNMPNVIVAKDHYTTLEQDLALIEAASFHMGMSSGPSTMAQFNRKPYCIFSWKINPALFRGMRRDGYRNRFYFSTEFQNWIIDEETPDSLITEFLYMWPQIRGAASESTAAQ